MKPIILVLLMAVTIQAQTLAEIARKERERQAAAKSTVVISSAETPAEAPKAEEPKPAATSPDQAKPADAKPTAAPAETKDAVKPQAPPAPDPVQVWNNQADQLRAKIRNLQDQELALLLQQNQTKNQVYAPVIDPATQDRLRAQLGEIDQQLAAVIKDLEDTKKSLDAMLLQGPPKK